jgi:hypothetical protein
MGVTGFWCCDGRKYPGGEFMANKRKAIPRDQKREARETDGNYAVFKQQLPELLKTHRGFWALLKNRKIIEFFETRSDAIKTGHLLFGDNGYFSIQQVAEQKPLTIIFLSIRPICHANHPRST